MNRLWQIWLMLVGDVMIVVGLAMVLAPAAPVFDFLNVPAWSRLLGTPGPEQAVIAYHGFTYGLAGAATVGWGILVFFAGWKGVPGGQAWVWQALAASMVVWFVIDTAHVLTAGVGSYAVFNLVMAAAALPPVIGLALAQKRTRHVPARA